MPTINAIRQATSSSKPASAVEAEALPWQLSAAVATSSTLPELLTNLARIVNDQADCLGLWFALPDESGALQPFRSVTGADSDAVWQVVEDLAKEIAVTAIDSGRQQHSEFQQNAQLIVSPAGDAQSDQTHKLLGVWAACFSTEQQTTVRQNWLMGMVSQSTSAWFGNRSRSLAESRSTQLNEIVTTFSALSNTDQLQQTSTVLCNQLRKHLAAEQVAVAVKGAGGLRLTAISDVEQIDPAADLTATISNACAAAAKAGLVVAYPPLDDQSPDEVATLQKFCSIQGAEACVSLPLTASDGSLLGTVLVTTTRDRMQTAATVEQFSQLTQLLGPHIDLVTRANRGLSQIIAAQWHKIRASNWSRNAMIATAALVLVMCLPLPYRVHCDCTIQPVQRRYLAAPYDGILDRATAKLGDVVSANDVLARMDEGNLRIELSGAMAELSAARKRRDSALAQGEVAQSQIARSEMKRHQAQIDLLNQRLENLEIRSPIDGLIVAGDLEKAEGAPLQMGQTVFEVAPLEQMLVEVAIEESEVGYTRPGMPVAIKLNAFPFQSWDGTVKRISPSTEIVNDKSVFVAEVEIANEDMKLKPGMAGSAKIQADRACLGWSLFHRPWESVRYWMVW